MNNARMTSLLKKLSALAASHAVGDETPTAIPGLTIWSSDRLTEPRPAMFEPSLYLVVQGTKRMIVGSSSSTLGPGSMSVSGVGVPFTGQVTAASPDTPYLALKLDFNAGVVASLLFDLPAQGASEQPAVVSGGVGDDIVEPFYRLTRLLSSPRDIAVLAPLAERELYYRVLQGGLGDAIRRNAQAHTRFSQVRSAVEWICANATDAMGVSQLAADVGMSPTSFHRHFKAVTGLSPLAYQRHVRLLHARKLLNAETGNVTSVAFEVGYASASQFSREYARMFGCPPARDTFRARQAALNAAGLKDNSDGRR